MNETRKQQQKPTSAADIRKAKLAAELRTNLQKRKAQTRARRAGEPDKREGIDES